MKANCGFAKIGVSEDEEEQISMLLDSTGPHGSQAAERS